MKLSQWMSEELDSHSMYDKAWVDKHLLELTKKKFKIPAFTTGSVRKEIGKHAKGPVWVKESLPDDTLMVTGYVVAVKVAETLLGKDPSAHLEGRGFRFQACLAALEKAGL